MVRDGDGFEGELEDEHGDSKTDEEEEKAFCRSAKPIAPAGIWGQLARLDRQHTRVQKNEGQIGQGCEGFVVYPPQRPEPKIEPKEGDADKKCHDHAGLLGVPGNHQHPTAENELAAHFERFPQEDEPDRYGNRRKGTRSHDSA
eukprot:948299-Prymnesium_polylepis.1